jgi:2-oxo-4-hydroxy-4-carboxy-5-ureidoimidazoline decarboxylase
MSIEEFNKLSTTDQRKLLLACGGSTLWADKLLKVFPFRDKTHLQQKAKEKWAEISENDWLEAFSLHPKIGDINSLKKKFAGTAAWASNEQSGMNNASDSVIDALAKENQEYEDRFGYIFIVFATDKSAAEMLNILRERMRNSPEQEWKIAAVEQIKITNLRIEKLFK